MPSLRLLLTLICTTCVIADTERAPRKTYHLDVPGKDPITIVEDEPIPPRWKEVNLNKNQEFSDVAVDHSRCFGPSCRENGFEEEVSPPDHLEEFLLEYADRVKGTDGDKKERLQAISSLASKLKRDRNKANYDNDEDDTPDYPYQTWNKLKIKKHKHPYDDRDGWVTLEAVPYSTSKVSKWKPNVSRPRPNHWDEDSPDGDRYSTSDRYSNTDDQDEDFRKPTKRPTIIMSRPSFNAEYNEPTTRPWTQQNSYPSQWAPDDSRRPHKNCDSDRYQNSNPSEVYYGMSDSVVTDDRPSNFPYEYQALKRPQRPTQVVYADLNDNRRPSHPTNGEGQWILLSTTKGYHRSKKRPRAMSFDNQSEPVGSMTSHHTVGLTVLPKAEGGNTTTSHGGLLEVERSFKTVEESKRDMEQANYGEETDTMDDQIPESSQSSIKRKKLKRRLVASTGIADSSSVLAAVGAGMLPATMAMVVPMMLGKRRRRRDVRNQKLLPPLLFRYE